MKLKLAQLNATQTQKQDAIKYRDVGSWVDRFAAMEADGQQEASEIEALRQRATDVSSQMIDLRYQLNNNQLGVVMHAADSVEKGQMRLVYTIPAGQGKSRVIVGLIAALCQGKPKANKLHFKVVYNHELQMKDDEQKIRRVCQANMIEVECVTAARDMSLTNGSKSNTVVIIDEVDAVILDKSVRLAKHVRYVGLTATAKEEFLLTETSLFEHLGFKIVDSGIQAQVSTEPMRTTFGLFFGE